VCLHLRQHSNDFSPVEEAFALSAAASIDNSSRSIAATSSGMPRLTTVPTLPAMSRLENHANFAAWPS
jgi:hypothetical protein